MKSFIGIWGFLVLLALIGIFDKAEKSASRKIEQKTTTIANTCFLRKGEVKGIKINNPLRQWLLKATADIDGQQR